MESEGWCLLWGPARLRLLIPPPCSVLHKRLFMIPTYPPTPLPLETTPQTHTGTPASSGISSLPAAFRFPPKASHLTPRLTQPGGASVSTGALSRNPAGAKHSAAGVRSQQQLLQQQEDEPAVVVVVVVDKSLKVTTRRRSEPCRTRRGRPEVRACA